MNRLRAAVICLASLLPPSAMAAETSAARSLCSRIQADNPLPPALKAKILIVQTAEPSPWMFTDPGTVSAADTEALANFDRALAPCRDAMLAALGSSPLAEQRRALFARNEKILFDLMARTISFGEANRRWEEAQLDYQRQAEARVQTPQRLAETLPGMSESYVASVRKIMAEGQMMASGIP